MSSRTTARNQRHYQHAATGARNSGSNAFSSMRQPILLLARALFIPLASATPLPSFLHTFTEDDDAPTGASDPDLYLYLAIALTLVLLGGVFAGLTIALMGQDETYLQVIATSGEGGERKHAAKVLNLLNKGKHWVLVTLLLSNVITNETLPIVLDRSLGGGWPAVLGSTVLIVIFGEIAPQSVCVRYGLSIGSFMAPFVLVLMWIMFPVAWPTAKLLDWLLGEDHGTMYKKAGLKTLVTLHKTLGTAPGERLMEDEVTIINSVLDLKEKLVGDIMTPMADVFTMSADTVLDERMMDTILSQGYSRIPIYAPDNSRNFIGMLLVKILITYDPEDARRVRDFSLATLPETAPYTSCLDIINFFQEGKSHMVLVSDFPGQDKGALGVVTLEDVIEELIGEEIIDESDVFIDVHKAIRRMAPAPKQRFRHHEPVSTSDSDREPSKERDAHENEPLLQKDSAEHDSRPSSRKHSLVNGAAPTSFMTRRKSSNASEGRDASGGRPTVPIPSNPAEMREHLKHLGPSNAANRPKATKFASVKIKPGVGTIPENQSTTKGVDALGRVKEDEPLSTSRAVDISSSAATGAATDEESRLLRSAGKDASDGAAALRQGYGTVSPSGSFQAGGGVGGRKRQMSATSLSAQEASKVAEEKAASPELDAASAAGAGSKDEASEGDRQHQHLKVPTKTVVGAGGDEISAPTKSGGDGDEANDGFGSYMGPPSRERSSARTQARSGSITETTVDIGGMKKVVLETTSSSSDGEDAEGGGTPGKKRTPGSKGLNGSKGGKKGSGSSADKR